MLARDCGVCAACGLDCIVLLQQLKRLRSEERKEQFGVGTQVFVHNTTLPCDLTALPRFIARLAELGIKGARRYLGQRLWEMDHVVPVSEGGGACGLDNLRTLCWRCHTKETTTLAGRRALSKRGT